MIKRPIPKRDLEKDYSDCVSGEVKTYFLTEEELAYYRSLPKPDPNDFYRLYNPPKKQV